MSALCQKRTHALQRKAASSFSNANRMESHTQMTSQYVGIDFDFAGRPFVHDMSVVDNVGTLCKRKRRGEILFHQHYGLTGVNELATNPHEVTHDDGCQAFEWLIQQNKLGIAHQRARDG